jgi:hypothetical protein
MIAVPIGPPMRMAVVATPGYFEHYGRPKTPQDLTAHNCINLRLPTDGTLYPWEFEKKGREVKVRVEGQLVFNTTSQITSAALEGMGLAWLPADRSAPYLANGQLEQVLADWCAPFPGYHLYYPNRRHASPAFTAFVAAVRYRPGQVQVSGRPSTLRPCLGELPNGKRAYAPGKYCMMHTLAAIGLGTITLLAVGSAAAQPQASHTLFAAGAQSTTEEAGYPRVIRLEHAGADNGVLLATFAHNGVPGEKGSLPVYRSADNGKTWSTTPVGVVRDTVHGWDIEAPGLFELPVAQGDLPAGTLFAAGTAWIRRDFRQQAIEVFISKDHGKHWTYRSNCATEEMQVNNEGHGIWEPYFAITADGSLNCFFSDERTSANGMGQVIAHVRSTDGGATWGGQINDVGIRDGIARPGMPTVLRLPTGSFVMSFENCKANKDSNHVCTVYLKTSRDGQHWLPMSDLGTPIATADGRRLLHTPALAWLPFGGANGSLIAAGQRVVTGPEGAVTIDPASGHTLMVNRTLGKGPWTTTPSPVVVSPTGGYGKNEIACPGYSSALLASGKAGDGSVLMIAGTANSHGGCDISYGSANLPR